MNVIKQISGNIRMLLLSMAMLFFICSSAFANSVFVSPLGAKLDTELDNVNVSLKTKFGWVLGGNKIIDNGENVSYLSIIPIDGTNAKYWPLGEGYSSKLFERKGNYYVLLSTGETLKIERTGLSETDFQLKPNSLIVAIEPNLVACTTLGIFVRKLSSKMASCYRADGAWDVDVYWPSYLAQPEVCGDKIKVLVRSGKRKWQVIVLELQTGKQLTSKKVAKPKGGLSVCQL